jgi:hypothetical protein|nr:MAG TPA: hypothetical protein [Caudoviricetes sp.]
MGSGVMRMEWSKKILVFSYFVLAVLIFVFLAESDKSSAAAVLCAWIAECGAATGFYFWKAKNENRSKYALKFVEKLADRYGIESTSRILETVLKD